MTPEPETFTEEQLSDPLFRLGYWDGSKQYPDPSHPDYRPSIYTIRNKFAKEERFVPNAAQCKLLKRIFIDGIRVLIVPKARQRGMSTLFALIVLDALLWSINIQATLVDFNGQNAKKKLDEKVIFAYKRLPAAIQPLTIIHTLNRQTGEFTIGPNPEIAGMELGKQTSTGFFGDQPRGGTNQLVWISEWAEIAARFPQRSADIRAGVLATANTGIIIIETTWHGGKRGDVYTFVKQALETPPEHRTKRTPWLEFFAWWGDPDNIEQGPKAAIRPDTLAYFREIKQKWPEELAGVEFTDAQMLWYQQTKTQQGIYMNGQHPTVLAECFQSIIKGAIWAEAIAKMRQEGRITNVPHDPSLEVDTFWDLGAPDNTAIKFVQHIGAMHHIIASQQGGWSLMPDLVRGLKQRGYNYGAHYIPHDGAQTARDGVTFEKAFSAELARQGCSGKIVTLPRCASVWPGVNHMTGLFQRCLVDSSCAGENGFIEAAEAYRRREDPRDDERFLDDIVKDWTSHDCDSVRMMAEADMLGYLPGTGNAVATKPYFDPGVLKDASRDAAANPPHLFSISNASGNIIRQVTATPDTAGWLRIWQEPRSTSRHLVSVLGRSMQVWRADGQDGLMALCAAPPWVQQLDFATLYRWAALASAHYGLAPIVLDIVSHPGGVRALQNFGAPILSRQQLEGKRPIGQEEATQHPGWEWKAEVAQHALAVMQGRIRQSRMILNCPSLIQQCGEFTNNLDGLPEVRDGVSVDAANCAALACLCHDLAGPFRSLFVAATGGHNVGIPGTGSGKLKRR